MWLAREQRQQPTGAPAAQLGQVTLTGAPTGVNLEGERRNVTVCLPGGYHWTPARGDTVLVLKSGPEETPCVVGRPDEEPPAAGEVWLSVGNGAGIRLKADGKVVLQGQVEVTGSLTVNGQEVSL